MVKNLFFDSEIRGRSTPFGPTPQPVVVQDIIVNEEHPEYSGDGFNIGTVFFKYTGMGGHHTTRESLFSARPMDISMQEYPLVGETVLVQKIENVHYYTKKINVNKTLQYNALPNSIERFRGAKSQQNRTIQSEQAKNDILQQTDGSIPEEPLFNSSYTPRENVNSLKYFDGDVILQNRFGATIRLGSSQMQDSFNQNCQITTNDNGQEICVLGPTNSGKTDAILVMRVGQKQNSNTTTDTSYALTVEDINLDSSCFVMSEKQDINFYFSSNFFTLEELEITDYKQTIDDGTGNNKTVLSENQAILNSGRIVLNSKDNDVILSSERDSIFGSNRNVIADAGNNIYLNPAVGKIFLGTISGDNSVAKYEELKVVLEDILNMIRTLSTTPASPGAPLSPPVAAKVSSTLLKIFDIESNLVKIRDWTIYKGT